MTYQKVEYTPKQFRICFMT